MNTAIAENAEHLHPMYDSAMEALSSLITTKRRGDVPTRSNKYSKLERMEMYVKVTHNHRSEIIIYNTPSVIFFFCRITLCMMIIFAFRNCLN